MENYIVLDLEATCDNPPMERDLSEIIEIGACFVNKNGVILSEFQTFVKPVVRPVLTDFCKGLVHIEQEQVDAAPGFAMAVDMFEAWIDECVKAYGTLTMWGSWGGYDKRQFCRNAALLDMEEPKFISKDHVNLKREYAKVVGLKNEAGVGKALFFEGITFEGIRHRGIDDARNTVKLSKVSLGIAESNWKDRPILRLQKTKTK